MPAIALALALLGALVAGGFSVVTQMRMVPGTLTASTERMPASRTDKMSSAKLAVPGRTATAGPGWETLSTAQKLALYPLAERWAFISEVQKRRWIALAENFPTLPLEEQAKLHSRMTDWANLSAQQRNQARLNFARTQKLLSSDNKRAQWEAYQALTDKERQQLAEEAVQTPAGAATALRPVPARKLAQVPAAATQRSINSLNPPKIPPVVDNQPRVAAPVLPPAPSPPPMPGEALQPAPPAPVVVETAPVVIPKATPAELPPLEINPVDPAAAPAPTAPATPDNSRLYPQ